MKTRVFLTFAAFMCIVYTSCYKEDALVASGVVAGERFVFPQGNSAHDQRIEKIDADFGVKIIYKNFKFSDFSLGWTTIGGNRFGYDIPADQQAEATGFLIDHIFGNLSPVVTKRVLPPYYYVADSVATKAVLGTLLENYANSPYLFDGMDFWCYSWNGARGYDKLLESGVIMYNPVPKKPTTSFDYFYRRGVILKEIYKSAIVKGNIQLPENFNTGFDFATATLSSGSDENVNFYKKRGFPGQMLSVMNFNMTALSNISRTNATQNFIDYVHLCMRYTPDSIEFHFPKAKFPLIHQKYPVVIEHMKTHYNVDLNKIATKPTI